MGPFCPSTRAAHPPDPHPIHCMGLNSSPPLISVVITLVFLTLLTVLVVIIIYLYRNKGSYLTYEQPAADADTAVQMEEDPSKEKEEYFI
uniref:Small cell adhesion glycoprotein n=1 Tax=Coturnix japonica TaxID=93934 RepID=A0A8C2SVQ3_COTJA